MNHVEWGNADAMLPFVEVLTPTEADEQLRPDEDSSTPVLCLDTGGSTLAIEGEPDALIAFGKRIVEAATAYQQVHDGTGEADPWQADPISPARGGR